MTTHEIELKFQVPEAAREALGQAVTTDGAAEVTRLQARYFDTADRLLGRSAFALRLRREGDGWVQTLKGRGDGMMKRLEHNAPIPEAGETPPELSLQRHSGTAAGQALLALLAQAGRGPEDLLLQFSTDISRTHRVLSAEGAQIELALDIGHIEGGGRTLPVHEIEFELVEGDASGLLAMASLWVEAFGLWLDVRSKAERGDRLARGLVHGEVPDLAPEGVQPMSLPFSQQVARALQPALALASDLAEGLATPAQQVALARAMAQLAEVLRAGLGASDPRAAAVTALAGQVFDDAVWRQPLTQQLWLALMALTLPPPA